MGLVCLAVILALKGTIAYDYGLVSSFQNYVNPKAVIKIQQVILNIELKSETTFIHHCCLNCVSLKQSHSCVHIMA